jgi:hypothetical protein
LLQGFKFGSLNEDEEVFHHFKRPSHEVDLSRNGVVEYTSVEGGMRRQTGKFKIIILQFVMDI